MDLHDVQTGLGSEIGMGVRKRVVVFRIERVWKGDISETLEMPAIERDGGTCLGFSKGLLEVGNELLVYANRPKGSDDYVTGLCSHTSLAARTKDFRELGPGAAPRKNVH